MPCMIVRDLGFSVKQQKYNFGGLDQARFHCFQFKEPTTVLRSSKFISELANFKKSENSIKTSKCCYPKRTACQLNIIFQIS